MVKSIKYCAEVISPQGHRRTDILDIALGQCSCSRRKDTEVLEGLAAELVSVAELMLRFLDSEQVQSDLCLLLLLLGSTVHFLGTE